MEWMLARILRCSAMTVLAVSGATLAWSTVKGPFQLLSLSVHSPLNAQSVFGLSVTILLLLNSRAGVSPNGKPRCPAAWLVGILLLTAAVLWPTLSFPLVFDDYTLARYGSGLNRAMAKYYLTQPGGDGFFRPVGYFSFGL